MNTSRNEINISTKWRYEAFDKRKNSDSDFKVSSTRQGSTEDVRRILYRPIRHCTDKSGTLASLSESDDGLIPRMTRRPERRLKTETRSSRRR